MTTKIECREENGLCMVNHCHSCKSESEHGCICKECIINAGNSWKFHYYNHQIKQDDCNMCKLGFSVSE